jgi:Ca2+/Na+ antiporter
MNGSLILLIGVTFGLLLILSQRVITKRKRMFRGFIVTWWLFFLLCRTDGQAESFLGFIMAVFISFVYWLLIGRYNPVNDKDEIKVYGLND